MEKIKQLRLEVAKELQENILSFWINRMQDDVNGGFYGTIDGDGVLIPDAPKGAVMHARILWTFSAAYRLLGKDEYLAMAVRAKDYLLKQFYDHQYGGIYWSLNADGTPLDTKKQFYALGFAIYGLSEFHRATGDAEALQYAIKLFEDIERYSYQPEANGYLEATDRQWQPISDVRLSDKDENEKMTMNTHLHILEPYTNLYRVWKDDRLKQQLVNLITIFRDKIKSQETHHLGLFFDENMQEKSKGTYSYGHDIEASWLLLEAALEINDPALIDKVKTEAKEICKAALEGYMPDGSLIYEHHSDGRLDEDRHWWVQAETVVGLYYQYVYYQDESALDLAIKTWEYIKTHLVDTEKGEWYWSIRADGSINTKDDKAGFWKCPYHNGRMAMEVISC